MVLDNYVKEEEGTGVVHQAPYFGAVSDTYIEQNRMYSCSQPVLRGCCQKYWPLLIG